MRNAVAGNTDSGRGWHRARRHGWDGVTHGGETVKIHIDLDDVGAPSTAWAAHAACRDSDPTLFFSESGRYAEAVEICAECPVRTECLEYALTANIDVGVWGGLSGGQRRTRRRLSA